MLYLEKRKVSTAKGESTKFYIRGTCPYTGEDVRKSTKTGSREQAHDVLAIFQARQRDRAMLGEGKVATFSEAVVYYLGPTIKGSDRFLDPLLDEFGTRKLSDVTDKAIADYCTKAHPTGKASTLVRQVYGPIQAVWNAASEAEPPLAPRRKLKKPPVVRPPVKYAKSDDHLQAILRKIRRPARRAGVLFSSFSGARASEVCRVLPEDHDRINGTILLGFTKNGKPRRVVLPDFVNKVICALPHDDPKAPLFDFPSRFELYKTLKRAAKAAKVEFLSPHKIGRHTFAARYLRDKNSLAGLRKAGGWESASAVDIYAHLEQDTVDTTVRNVTTSLRDVTTDVTPKQELIVPKKQDIDRAA